MSAAVEDVGVQAVMVVMVVVVVGMVMVVVMVEDVAARLDTDSDGFVSIKEYMADFNTEDLDVECCCC